MAKTTRRKKQEQVSCLLSFSINEAQDKPLDEHQTTMGTRFQYRIARHLCAAQLLEDSSPHLLLQPSKTRSASIDARTQEYGQSSS